MTTNNQERVIKLSLLKEQEPTLAGNTKYLNPAKSITEWALQYVKHGISVIPLNEIKIPTISRWKPYQENLPQTSDLLTWWEKDGHSIAIVCGRVSKNIEGIDFDEKYNLDPIPIFIQWKTLVDKEKPGLIERLVKQKTMHNGVHLIYRCDVIGRNMKLAQRATTVDEQKKDPDEKSKVLIETRGEGGYLACYPSKGYAICNGNLTDIPEITPEEREIMLSCARALNRYVAEKDVIKEKRSKSNGNRPGDCYNRDGDHKVLLEKHGWTLVGNNGNNEHWRRPGKKIGYSATYFTDTKLFYNFSSSVSLLDSERAYTNFSLFTFLEANGDYSEAAKQLAEQGFGELESSATKLAGVEKYLASKNEFRRNCITEKIEYRSIGDSSFIVMTDTELNSLHLELTRNKLEIGFDAFNRLLLSDFVEEYDPVRSYFEGLEAWDGNVDYIKLLAKSVTLKEGSNRKAFEECLERWLIGYIACAIDPESVNQTAIILVGEQGIGKSRWLNRLVPDCLSKYRFVGNINPENKDSEIYLSECILINLDELEILRKADIGALKTTMSKPAVKIRRPYGRLTEDLVRRASFVGSINSTEFLNDPTGSRRFLTFEVTSIDFSVIPDIDKVLSQAYTLYNSGDRWWFDEKEIKEINERNKEYSIISYEEECLLELSKAKVKAADKDWFTATQIAERIKLLRDNFQISDKSVRNLGYALTKHNYEFKKTNGSKKYAIEWV